MIKRGYKLIVCVVLVSALFICFGSAFAFAESSIVTRIKATVAAALLANSLVMEPVNVALDTLSYSIVDPLNKLEWNETLPEYLEKSTIKVIEDYVTIDDTPYSLVWLGPEAADKLRLKGLDFTTAYNILNNQSEAISYASGLGYIHGVPIYSVDGLNRSPYYTTSDLNTFLLGDYTLTYSRSGNTLLGELSYDDVNFRGTVTGSSLRPDPSYTYFYYGSNRYNIATGLSNGQITSGWNGSRNLGPLVSDPFSFDYTSGIIDAPIAEDDGLLLQIPSSYSDPDNPQYNYDIHDLINIYPQVTQDHGAPIEIDPELNPDFQTDIDLGNNVGDLIRIILSILDLLDHTTVEFAPEPESPQPGPVDPEPAIPDTPVSDQDGTWLDELLRWIKHAIDVLHQDLEDVLNAIDTQFTEIYNMLEEEFDAIREWMENVPDVIKRAHAKGMKDAISALKKIVLPLLAPIKALMNLWHYVVEWFTSINAPLIWIFSIMSASSYYMVLPIYASLAGVICIAIYKSFGR